MKCGEFCGLILGALACATAVAARPVEFRFAPVDGAGATPYAREIWAEVTTPQGRALRLPAFYAGDGVFAVRVRADASGEFRLGAITETRGAGELTPADCRMLGERTQQVSPDAEEKMPQVRLDPQSSERFVTSDGKFFAPLGANLAWAESDNRARWYADALHGFAQAELNWARIWMASWGGLDLGWLPEDMGQSPPTGVLDERVAVNWDRLLAAAEKEGVYVQLVLQHHGQWSSQVNPNWKGNPWNAANPGGFLKTAGEFFTSAEAKRLTKQKYRTIVARWGYSPAIMAWELFNEVHWVDALRLDHNEAAVAAWHDEMAAYLRSLDVYGHLVTTSTEDLASPIYRSMDYYQPHLYPSEPIPAARRHDAIPADRRRPLFYGEQGDDHLKFTAEQRESGVEMASVVWASLMGEGLYAAQPWEGSQMLAKGREAEMRAVARFLKATKLGERQGLVPFSPRIESETKVPMVLVPSERWHKRPPQTIALAADGSLPLAYGTLPAIFVGKPASLAEGYSNRLTLQVEFAEHTKAKVRIADVAAEGASARVLIDGESIEHRSLKSGQPAEMDFDIPAGQHTLQIENSGEGDWFEVGAWTFDRQVPALAAIGRRGPDFVALWFWHRDQIFSLTPGGAAKGWLDLDAIREGNWRITWWDSETGEVRNQEMLQHAGGELRLAIPAIGRHAAVALERQ